MAETDVQQPWMSHAVPMALSQAISAFSKRLYQKPSYEFMNYNITF